MTVISPRSYVPPVALDGEPHGSQAGPAPFDGIEGTDVGGAPVQLALVLPAVQHVCDRSPAR